MVLSPAERILLLNLLPPAEGSATLLRGVRKFRKELAFSDQEIIDWKVVESPPGAYRWEGDQRAEIEISPVVYDHLRSRLKFADEQGKLHEGLLNLFDQFFPEQL